MAHKEQHHLHRSGWLRAAVLGANDGIVSTASLMLGIAASRADSHAVVVAGAASLVAGACSMAAGEYISVSSQADTEKADLDIEARALADCTEEEHQELADIYVERGLEPGLAAEVARQLMRKDALDAHARDELGLTETLSARPHQAAWTSAASFAAGALVPMVTALLLPAEALVWGLGGISLVCLGTLGAIAAKASGAPIPRSTLRVLIWGVLAMAVTSGVGALFGVSG